MQRLQSPPTEPTGGALRGRRVIVTRARTQAHAFVARLQALGAVPIVIPVIEIRPPADPGPLDEAARRLAEFDWVVFASVHGVAALLERVRSLAGVRVAAVGGATAAALEERGQRVDLVPAETSAKGLVEALARVGVTGARILLPQAHGGRAELEEGLTRHGAQVCRVTAYETVTVPIPADAARRLALHGADAVTFTSPSTVHGFVAGLRAHGWSGPWGFPAFCIGPTTAAAARGARFEVAAVPERAESDALVDLLVEYFSTGNNERKR